MHPLTASEMESSHRLGCSSMPFTADTVLKQVPVLVMSAATVPSTIIDADIEGFLSKPFDLDSPTGAVSTILSSHT